MTGSAAEARTTHCNRRATRRTTCARKRAETSRSLGVKMSAHCDANELTESERSAAARGIPKRLGRCALRDFAHKRGFQGLGFQLSHNSLETGFNPEQTKPIERLRHRYSIR